MKTRIINSGATMGLIVAAMLLLASCQSKAIDKYPRFDYGSFIFYNKCSNAVTIHTYYTYSFLHEETIREIASNSYLSLKPHYISIENISSPWEYKSGTVYDSLCISNGLKEVVYRAGDPIYNSKNYTLLYKSGAYSAYGWTFTDADFENGTPIE